MTDKRIEVLLHGYEWAASSERVALEEGIELAVVLDAEVADGYDHFLDETWTDAEELSSRNVTLFVNPQRLREDRSDVDDQYSLVSRLYNVVLLVGEVPSASVSVVRSADGFRSVEDRQISYWTGSQTEFLQDRTPSIDDAAIRLMAELWSRSELHWRATRADGRIIHALTQFGRASRAAYLEEVALHLAVSLRSVSFSLPINASTDLAQRLVHYVGVDELTAPYQVESLRRFFALESRVHAGDPHVNEALVEVIPSIYHFTCRVLRNLLREDPGAGITRRTLCPN